MREELGVKGGVLGNERIGVEKWNGGGHRASILLLYGWKRVRGTRPGQAVGCTAAKLGPSLVTPVLSLL